MCTVIDLGVIEIDRMSGNVSGREERIHKMMVWLLLGLEKETENLGKKEQTQTQTRRSVYYLRKMKRKQKAKI